MFETALLPHSVMIGYVANRLQGWEKIHNCEIKIRKGKPVNCFTE
jgi:hypothetical protein